MRLAAGSTVWEEEIMTSIKAMKTSPRERSTRQNGLPEPVPYVYREEKRRNTYAARIARRNTEGRLRPVALAAGADDLVAAWRSAGVEVHSPQDMEWRRQGGAVVDPDGNVIRFGSPIRLGRPGAKSLTATGAGAARARSPGQARAVTVAWRDVLPRWSRPRCRLARSPGHI
jgi:hypothetical protein